MRIIRTAISVAAIASLAGCLSYAKPITSADVVAPTDSYVYGRFALDAKKTWLGLNQSYTIAVEIMCSDNKKYPIKFVPAQEVQVIRVPAGRCGVNRVLFADGSGNLLGVDEGFVGPHNNFPTNPGEATYIGEYNGETKAAFTGLVTWKLSPLSVAYAKTTSEMRELYPNLDGVEARNVFGQ